MALHDSVPGRVLTSQEACRPYECDGLSAYRRTPDVVVLPETVDEVRAILRLCHEFVGCSKLRNFASI